MHNLKAYRQKAGFTQIRLAQRCNMHPGHISLIEGGARPSKRTARKIAEAFDAQPAEVFPEYETFNGGREG